MALKEGTFLSLPKLPGRLTAELVLRSPQNPNALKEYELNLRGALFIALCTPRAALLFMPVDTSTG